MFTVIPCDDKKPQDHEPPGLYFYFTRVLSTKCNTFTPQIKGIPEDTFAMYISTQGDMSMYTGVY